MTWETILKIKNNQGENLKVKDVAAFTRRLRDELNHVGSEHYGKITQALNEDDPRKSNVVVKETWISRLSKPKTLPSKWQWQTGYELSCSR